MMEQFDVLDKNGNPTGMTADKGASLAHGQYYLGAHAYIYNPQNEFLLQRRALHKKLLPGAWDIHMGHVAAGETSKSCIIREIGEEIGLSFPYDNIRFIGRIVWEREQHMVDIYFLQVDFKLDELELDREEVIGVKAVSAVDMLAVLSSAHFRPLDYRQLVSEEIARLIDFA